VAQNKKPELVLNALKANATRRLREEELWGHKFSPWAFKGSRRRLWNQRSVDRAIDYVLYGQGDEPPDFDDETYCFEDKPLCHVRLIREGAAIRYRVMVLT
jgi:hypothetical protein